MCLPLRLQHAHEDLDDGVVISLHVQLSRQAGLQVGNHSALVVPSGVANTRSGKRPLHGAGRDPLVAHGERGASAKDLPLQLRERLVRLQLTFQDLVEFMV